MVRGRNRTSTGATRQTNSHNKKQARKESNPTRFGFGIRAATLALTYHSGSPGIAPDAQAEARDDTATLALRTGLEPVSAARQAACDPVASRSINES